MANKDKKSNRGGARDGAGRPSPFSEKTKIVNFRCPESKVKEFKAFGDKKLEEWHEKKST